MEEQKRGSPRAPWGGTEQGREERNKSRMEKRRARKAGCFVAAGGGRRAGKRSGGGLGKEQKRKKTKPHLAALAGPEDCGCSGGRRCKACFRRGETPPWGAPGGDHTPTTRVVDERANLPAADLPAKKGPKLEKASSGLFGCPRGRGGKKTLMAPKCGNHDEGGKAIQKPFLGQSGKKAIPKKNLGGRRIKPISTNDSSGELQGGQKRGFFCVCRPRQGVGKALPARGDSDSLPPPHTLAKVTVRGASPFTARPPANRPAAAKSAGAPAPPRGLNKIQQPARAARSKKGEARAQGHRTRGGWEPGPPQRKTRGRGLQPKATWHRFLGGGQREHTRAKTAVPQKKTLKAQGGCLLTGGGHNRLTGCVAEKSGPRRNATKGDQGRPKYDHEKTKNKKKGGGTRRRARSQPPFQFVIIEQLGRCSPWPKKP